MFVTTYAECSQRAETFIRLNNTEQGAIDIALEEMKLAAMQYPSVEIETVEAETSEYPTVIRLFNSETGFEYEAFIIKEYKVGE